MRDVVLYRDPVTGGTEEDQYDFYTVAQSEAAGALAMTRAQAEDSLSSRLLNIDQQILETGTAVDLATALYSQAVKDPERKEIHTVKKPVSPVLIAIAVYLVLLWL